MALLEQHFSFLQSAVEEARAAPLSSRKARLAVALLDSYVDRLYLAHPAGAEDLLAFRVRMCATSVPLSFILAFAEQGPHAPSLRLESAAPLSSSDYDGLSEAEYMVSLYNDATIPRLLLITSDGATYDIHQALRIALTVLADGKV